VKILHLAHTGHASPSQWHGRTEDNRKVYIRYRHGRLSVRIGKPGSHDHPIEIYHEYIEKENDGYIEWKEIKKRIKRININKVLDERAKKMGFYTAPLTDQRRMVDWLSSWLEEDLKYLKKT